MSYAKESIEDVAEAIEGIYSAYWDINTKDLHLHFNLKLTSTEKVSAAVAKIGYATNRCRRPNAKRATARQSRTTTRT